jgi:4-amino-4-deoxy-L-arabinose transferase-like glycosyltransferase
MNAVAAAPRPADAPDGRAIALLLALATLVAAALRLPFLATQSFWLDETYTVHVVGAGSLGELWDRIGATESTPPLFYLLAWGWTHALGSHGEATLRTLPALASIAAVPVAFAALRRLAGCRAALAAAAVVAVSPLLVSYALDARAYTLLVLTGLLSVWVCSAALEEPTPRRLALWALAGAAAIWTHWFAGFLVLGEAVALVWLRPEARRSVLLASIAVLAAVAPLAGLLSKQTSDARAGFIGGSGLTGRLEQLVRQFAAGPNVPRTWLEAACLALFLAALALGTALTARRALGRRADDGARALLAIALVALLVPLALAATGLYDRFNLRNVLFLAPLAAALVAPALLHVRALPLAAYLALCVATGVWVQSDWRYGNPDWRGAIRRIEATAPGLPVVAVTPLGASVAALYLDRQPSATPVTTRHAWLLVEPARTPGHRALAQVSKPAIPGFTSGNERILRGFRLIDLRASRVLPLDQTAVPMATLFAGPGN